jgi:hypothetical protein
MKNFVVSLAVILTILSIPEFSQAGVKTNLSRSGTLTITDDGGDDGNEYLNVVFERGDRLFVETYGFDGTEDEFDANSIKRIRISMRAGNDQVVIRSRGFSFGVPFYASHPTIDVEVNTGTGDSGAVQVSFIELGAVTVRTNRGQDSIDFNSNAVVNGNLKVFTGSDVDFLYFSRTRVTGRTIVDSGSGDDELTMFESDFGKDTVVTTGSGADLAYIGLFPGFGNMFAGKLFVSLGGNNDRLIMGDGTHDDVRLYGGGGQDCFFQFGTEGFDADFRLFSIEVCDGTF